MWASSSSLGRRGQAGWGHADNGWYSAWCPRSTIITRSPARPPSSQSSLLLPVKLTEKITKRRRRRRRRSSCGRSVLTSFQPPAQSGSGVSCQSNQPASWHTPPHLTSPHLAPPRPLPPSRDFLFVFICYQPRKKNNFTRSRSLLLTKMYNVQLYDTILVFTWSFTSFTV